MTPHRKETRISANQPVRFYKVIALCFLFITIAMLGLIVFMSSKRATITITTKEAVIDVNFSLKAGSPNSEQNFGNIVTTTPVVLSQSFSPTGTREEVGVAGGTITIHNESNTAQPLVATTRFLSTEGALFHLKDRITVPANGTIEAEVYADQEGVGSNIGPTSFIIPGLNQARQKQVFGTSDKTMSGGIKTIGIIRKEDIDKAKEILLEEIKTAGKKQLEGMRQDYVGIFSVIDNTYEADAELGEEVSEFIVTMTADVLAVLYDANEVKTLASDELMKRSVDDTEVIRPSDNTPAVSIDSYDKITNEAVLSVFYDGTASLNPESRQLEKAMFFGKNKDEIRRYVLALEHVHSVECDFSPAWIRAVPYVDDHVNVVIKNVR